MVKHPYSKNERKKFVTSFVNTKTDNDQPIMTEFGA
jgi:hypothetical protein